MRILITGSRTWSDWRRVYEELDWRFDGMPPGELVVVHGACPTGADSFAAAWARQRQGHAWRGGRSVREEAHPADWDLGKRAGFARSTEMVNLGADMCLAFIRDRSAGATHTARLALDAGLALHVWREPPGGAPC